MHYSNYFNGSNVTINVFMSNINGEVSGSSIEGVRGRDMVNRDYLIRNIFESINLRGTGSSTEGVFGGHFFHGNNITINIFGSNNGGVSSSRREGVRIRRDAHGNTTRPVAHGEVTSDNSSSQGGRGSTCSRDTTTTPGVARNRTATQNTTATPGVARNRTATQNTTATPGVARENSDHPEDARLNLANQNAARDAALAKPTNEDASLNVAQTEPARGSAPHRNVSFKSGVGNSEVNGNTVNSTGDNTNSSSRTTPSISKRRRSTRTLSNSNHRITRSRSTTSAAATGTQEPKNDRAMPTSQANENRHMKKKLKKGVKK